MSTADKLNYLQETKNQIKNAIEGKGVSIADTDSFRSYASKIGQIQDGGGNVDEYFNSTLDTNANYVFNTLVKKIPFNFNTSNVTNMSYMFYHCKKLSELNLSNFNTSNATNMSFMFGYCMNLTELDLSSFDTSKVANMSSMFGYCLELRELNLSSFNTSNVTNMNAMFYYCSKPTELDLSSFDTSNATNVNDMFRYCSALQTIKGILNVIKVTESYNINRMLNGCLNLESVNIRNLNANGLDLTQTPKLSHDSLIYLINNLVQTTMAKTLKLGATNLAKLTDEEIAIATEKGWTLA